MRGRLLVLAVLLGAVVVAGVVLRRPTPAPPVLPRAGAPAFHGLPGARAVVWAIGDGAAGKPVSGTVAGLVAADHPDRVLYLGDVYESGTQEEFERNMRGAYGPLLARMLPTPGNHEWPLHATGYDPFWRGVTGRPTPSWYATRVAGWELLSLNSEAPHDAASPQLGWARRELAGRGTCRLAFFHRPRFSAGRHGDQDDMAPVWRALTGHATLVLSGHDHDSQRFAPVDGLTQLVSGAGGRDRYGVGADPRLAFADDAHFGAVRLVLQPGAARVSFFAADGRRLDDSTVRCRS